MAEYRLKPGRLGQKVLDTYQKTEQAFAEKFLQEDPDSPSGYRLKTGKPESRLSAPTPKSSRGLWAPTKRWRTLL